MKIALVAPLVTTIAQPYAGGSQALVAELARGLTRRGHAVTLFAREGSLVPDIAIETVAVPESVQPAQFAGPLRERPHDDGFFAQANIFLNLFMHLRRRQEEFELIHAHAFDWPSFICSALVHTLPVAHTIHLPAVSPEINEGLRVLHQQGHPLTLITVSHACARAYADYTPCDAVVYNGLDVAALPFGDPVAVDAPLLFVGRITPEKGVEAAIEIAEMTGQRLLIAGGVYDRSYYEMRIVPRLREAQGRVTYLGQLAHSELWRLMSGARGLLFPIEWDEPFGLTMVEAMATGTPVIAYKRGAAEEIVRHGETGFLVTPGAREEAAAYVEKLSQISREACRFHVEQQFSFEHMLDAYERIYAGMVAGHAH
jgi:UDP-glucose:tetrahydrobiopterin glucosyltransferase